jgi:hypothetical protein
MRALLHALNAHHGLPWFVLLGQFGFDFGDGGGALGGFLDDIAAFLLEIIQLIWSILVAVANYIFAVLQFIWNFLVTLFNDIKDAFKWIWNNVIKAVLTKLVSVFQKVRAWLQQTFGPVLRFLKKIRAWYDKLFNQYVRPFLNVLRHIRQVLQIFRLLGFKWAARLDADLGRIEQAITKVYTTLRKYINEAITWIQLVVDPLGILRRNPLFAGLIRSAKELENIHLQVTQRPLFASEAATCDRNRTWFSGNAPADNLKYYKQGQLPPDMEDARQEFLKANTNPGSVPTD